MQSKLDWSETKIESGHVRPNWLWVWFCGEKCNLSLKAAQFFVPIRMKPIRESVWKGLQTCMAAFECLYMIISHKFFWDNDNICPRNPRILAPVFPWDHMHGTEIISLVPHKTWRSNRLIGWQDLNDHHDTTLLIVACT